VPDLREVNTILSFAPQEGSTSGEGSTVIRVWPVPLAFITKISPVVSPRSDTKVILVPSGDHWGA
jgi:hypothetical protein